MRKTVWIILTMLLLGIFWLVYVYIPKIMLGMITDFEPYTFERILQYDSMRLDYGIGSNDHPEDYGYSMTEEIDYTSLDGTKLNAWHIPSNPDTNVCVIFIHGRTDNRLKCMKYLKIFKDAGMDTVYNFFLADFRNSGKSQPAKTYMGYKFSEDLVASLQYLQKNKGYQTFIPFGFSMGAMTIFTTLNRDDMMKLLNEDSIQFSKIIVDSPLSNVKETLQLEAKKMKLPTFIFNKAWSLFDKEINGMGDNLDMSLALSKTNIPILIQQSKADKTTLYSIFEKEWSDFKNRTNTQVFVYDTVDHVRIYQDSLYHKQYSNRVVEFMKLP